MAEVFIWDTLPVVTSITSAISYIFNSSTKYNWIIIASLPSSLVKAFFKLSLSSISFICSSGFKSFVMNQLEYSSYESSKLLETLASKAWDHSKYFSVDIPSSLAISLWKGSLPNLFLKWFIAFSEFFWLI